MALDIRDPELAYTQKPNIVRPGSVAQITAAQERAAQVQELNDIPTPSTRSRAGAVITDTKLIKREL